jgi:uncharacterized radical SAM superfamily protein
MKKVLDLECASYGYKMMEKVKEVFKKDGEVDKNKVENHLQKSLRILYNEGIFAFFIYQGIVEEKSVDKVKEKSAGSNLFDQVLDFLKDMNFIENVNEIKNERDMLQKINKIREVIAKEDSLDRLIFIKRLLERTLTYSWYYARAL